MTANGDVHDVLVVSPPTALWGAQLRLLDYAPHLAARGLRLTLGSPPDGELHAAWVGAGLAHRDLAVPYLAGIRDPATDRRPPPGQLARTAARAGRGAAALVAAAGDFDAIWSFHLRAHPGAVAAARLRRVPVAIEIVDIVRPGAGRRLLQRCAAHADATIVNSDATGAALEGRGRNVHVVHPGVDTDAYRPGATTDGIREQLALPGGVLVGIAGRIDPEKGVDVLVEAIGQLADDLDVRLTVIGEAGVSSGDYAAEVTARAGELLGDRARFVGRRDDMPEVLRALDIFVNASRAEPFGRSVLEAQATGLPVIGTSQGGIPEFVADRRTGLLVAPGDAAGLARAIGELAADPASRTALGVAARAQVVERFDIVDRYDIVAAILGTLVGRR